MIIPSALIGLSSSYLTLGIADTATAEQLWAVYAIIVAILAIINIIIMAGRHE